MLVRPVDSVRDQLDVADPAPSPLEARETRFVVAARALHLGVIEGVADAAGQGPASTSTSRLERRIDTT